MRVDILESKEQILLWISENRSKAFMCHQLQCKTYTLDSWLRKMGIIYKGNRGRKGNIYPERRISAADYAKGSCVSSKRLKEKLIAEGIKEDRCEKCNLAEWQGEKIPTELHHKDGNHFNNEFSNLAILCCNCHALTDDYSVRKHFEPKKVQQPSIRKSNRKSPRTKSEMAGIIRRTPTEYHNERNKQYWDSQQQYIPLVINSEIDFSKFGWVTKLSAVIHQEPQRVHKWMKKFLPDFYKEKCFKRFSS